MGDEGGRRMEEGGRGRWGRNGVEEDGEEGGAGG